MSAATTAAPPPLAPDLPSEEARRRIGGSALGSWPVADDVGLLGMVRTSDIIAAASDGRGSVPVRQLLDTITNADHGGLPHVHGDHPLGLALARMGSTRHTVLPVVSRANVRTMLGVVTLPDILHVYGVERVDEVSDLSRRLDE